MINSLFTPYLRAPLNSGVDSLPILLDWITQPVTVVVNSGTGALLIVNGAPAGASASVGPTDRLSIRLTASTGYATASHAVITIDGIVFSFTVVTLDDPRLYAYPPQIGVLPVDLHKNRDGSDFYDNGSSNKLARIASNGQLLSRIAAEYTGQAPTSTGSNGVVYSPQSLGNFVLRLDRRTFEILGSTEVGKAPFRSAIYGTPGPTALHLVTISEENRVVVLDNSGAVVDSIPTQERPLGITCSSDGRALVACGTGLTIDVLVRNAVSGKWSVQSSISTGSRTPFDLAYDGQYVWATCPANNVLLRVDSTGAIAEFALTGAPTSIVYDGASLWVTQAGAKSVVRWSAATGSVLESHAVQSMPYSLAVAAAGSVYVGCFGRSAVYRLVNGVAPVQISADQRYPYQLQVDSVSGTLAVFEYYPLTPDYLYVLDSRVEQIAVTDIYRVRTLQNITTNVTSVRGLSEGISVPVSVPAMYGATIVKNLTSVGVATTVVNGDQISLAFQIPSRTDCAIQLPLFIGNSYDYFLSTVPVPDPIIFPVAFAHLTAAQLNTTYTSNTVVISGLDAGTSITLTINGGTLIKNGSQLPGTPSVSITNGDTIAIRAASSTNMGVAFTCLLNFGAYRTYWSIITSDIERNWLTPAYAATSSVYDISIPTQIGDGYKTRNSVRKIRKSDYMVGAASSLYKPAIVSNPTLGADFNYAVSYYENRIYKISPNGSVAAISTFDATALPRADGLYSPQFHGKELMLKTRYVSISKLHIREVDTPDADVPLYVGSGWAPCTAKSTDGQYVYVGQSERTIEIFKWDPSISLFTKHSAVDCSKFCALPGGFRDFVVDGPYSLWVLDVVNNLLLHVVAGTVVSVTGLGNANVWAMVAGTNSIWLADTKYNIVIRVNSTTGALQAIVRVGSVPSAMSVDSTTGNIWVAYYASSKIDIINPNTNQITRTLDVTLPVAALREDSAGNIWVLHMYPDLYTSAASTIADAAIPIPVFTAVVGAAPFMPVRSNSVVISGLPRPMRITVADVNNTRFYLNGAATGASTAVLSNGDVLSLGTDASPDFASTNNVVFTGFNKPVQWSVTTAADITPDYVYFDTIYGVRTRYTAASSSVVLSGMSPGATATLSVRGYPNMKINVNGVTYTGAAPAGNGSIVTLGFDTTGWYYGQTTVFELQHGLTGSATTFGTFEVSTLSLLGAIKSVLYDVSTYDYVSHIKTVRHKSILVSGSMAAAQLSRSGAPTFSSVMRPVDTVRRSTFTTALARSPVILGSMPAYTFAQPPQPEVRRSYSRYEIVPEANSQAVPSLAPRRDTRYTQSAGPQFGPRLAQHSAPAVNHEVADAAHRSLAPLSVYEAGVRHHKPAIGTSYEAGVRHHKPTAAAYYEPGVGHHKPAIGTSYEAGVRHHKPAIGTSYEAGVRHHKRGISVYYEPGVRHLGAEVSTFWERNIPIPIKVAAPVVWERGNPHGATRTARSRFILAPSPIYRFSPVTGAAVLPHGYRFSPVTGAVVLPHVYHLSPVRETMSARHISGIRSIRSAELVRNSRNVFTATLSAGPLKAYSVNKINAGFIGEQGVFATEQEARSAALALGYKEQNITASWFHTDVYNPQSGLNEIAIAWMWRITPEITSRNCGGSDGVEPRFPVPQKWYVQGG